MNPALAPYAKLPSQSPVYRSVARAVAAGDPLLFGPGESNLDWRRWAIFEDEALAPKKAEGAAGAKRR